ncbi:MAG TPA: PadR family transcriptional regulator [Gemmatimonadaceae bacterium]|nr:PadR family transcriptional regulator [Gemmatimonadaceae bacterium]
MADRDVELLQGTLDVLVLKALSWGPMHGYAIARWIGSTTDGDITVLDGALYTSLHRMDARGWIEAEWGLSEKGKRARFYRPTTEGRRRLRAEAASWQRYASAVSKVLGATAQPA